VTNADWASAPADGQLADDGRSFWSDGAWVSSTSDDGTSRWDGIGWVPQERTFFRNTIDDTADVDDRSKAVGNVPPRVESFPSKPLYEDRHVAIGADWLGIRTPPVGRWRLIGIRDIQSVAIVPPSRVRQIAFLRSPTTPKPFIAIKDRLGRVVSVNVVKFSLAASTALDSRLPADADVTGAARMFLDGRSLPGQWGKKFNWFKSVD
jgi:hypothetical protein